MARGFLACTQTPAAKPQAVHRRTATARATCVGRTRGVRSRIVEGPSWRRWPREARQRRGVRARSGLSERTYPNVRRSGRRVVRWPAGGDAHRRQRPRDRHRPADAGAPRAHHAWQWLGSDRAASREHSRARHGIRHRDATSARRQGPRQVKRLRRPPDDTAGRLRSAPGQRGRTTAPRGRVEHRDQHAGRLTPPKLLRAEPRASRASWPPTARPAACPPRGGA